MREHACAWIERLVEVAVGFSIVQNDLER